MIGDGWIMCGLVMALGLPLGVLVALTVWPERIPADRTVEAIRTRLAAGGSCAAIHDADLGKYD
ncbi:hypothetical protein [Nocardia sp. CA-120079]|uniref:hypothetical protein n=1 Tax=Nocardia sp. CA-120079 TaxID=3239974 RepID=UPI003D952D6B